MATIQIYRKDALSLKETLDALKKREQGFSEEFTDQPEWVKEHDDNTEAISRLLSVLDDALMYRYITIQIVY